MRRCLVIRYGGYGDAIQMASILPGLRAEGWSVHVDVSAAGEVMLRHDPHIAGMLITPAGSIPEDDLPAYWQARGNGFHRVVNLCGSIENGLLPLPRVLGFYHDDATRRRLYGPHNYVERLHLIAGVPPPYRPWYYETAEEMAEVSDGPAVMLCLAGSAEYKVWPHAPQFAVQFLLAHPGHRLLLAGGRKDAPLAEAVIGRVADMLGDATAARVVDMTEAPMRLALAAAIKADAVVGPETGVMNAVACRANRKVVLMSHSTVTNLVRDWVNTRAIVPGVACHPCHRLHQSTQYCPRGGGDFAACASAISPGEVLAALGVSL